MADDKGYRLLNFNKIIEIYSQSKKVQQIRFILSSKDNHNNNGLTLTGSHFEVSFESLNVSHIKLRGGSFDDVNSIFYGTKDILKKYRNRNGWIRNTWTDLVVQLLGVVAVFVISIVVGNEISSYIKIENSFVFSFFFVFIFLSNLWGTVFSLIQKFIYYAFPNIRFVKKDRPTMHWITKSLVGGILVSFSIFTLSWVLRWVEAIIVKHFFK